MDNIYPKVNDHVRCRESGIVSTCKYTPRPDDKSVMLIAPNGLHWGAAREFFETRPGDEGPRYEVIRD